MSKLVFIQKSKHALIIVYCRLAATPSRSCGGLLPSYSLFCCFISIHQLTHSLQTNWHFLSHILYIIRKQSDQNKLSHCFAKISIFVSEYSIWSPIQNINSNFAIHSPSSRRKYLKLYCWGLWPSPEGISCQ